MGVLETTENQDGFIRAFAKHKYIDIILICAIALTFIVMILLSTALV